MSVSGMHQDTAMFSWKFCHVACYGQKARRSRRSGEFNIIPGENNGKKKKGRRRKPEQDRACQDTRHCADRDKVCFGLLDRRSIGLGVLFHLRLSESLLKFFAITLSVKFARRFRGKVLSTLAAASSATGKRQELGGAVGQANVHHDGLLHLAVEETNLRNAHDLLQPRGQRVDGPPPSTADLGVTRQQ